jgi:hypothetical protein
MSGKKVRTLVSHKTLVDLCYPDYLSYHKDTIFVSDHGSDCVFVVSLATGDMLHTITHSQMSSPYQVCVSGGGTLLVANEDGECVLACPAGKGGEGRVLLRGEQHGEGEYVHPKAVCVTDTSLLVSWWGGGGSVVKKYDCV